MSSIFSLPLHWRGAFVALVLGLSWSALGGSASAGGEPSGPVGDFALIDHQGAFHHLYYHAKDPQSRAIVLFVQGNGCPLVRKQVPVLNRLRDAYASRGVTFWMINANRHDSREEVLQEAADYGIELPILLDETQLVAQALGIVRTAEAIVIEPNTWRIRYRGAIDDRLGYETQRPEAGRGYLTEALDALLAGEAIRTGVTSAPGCLITYSGPAAAAPYSDTIAPLLKANCVGCHTRGGIGPFAMSRYEKVRGWSDMIREVLVTRRMPPWQADPHVGSFGNDFSLSPDEVRTVVQWIDAGSPRGAGVDPLAGYQPELPEWKLGTPDYIVQIPEQSVAAEGVFDYRYITVEAPNSGDVWLRAVEIVPGNPRVLHHIIATTVLPGEGRKQQKALAGYAPGMGPDLFPAGTGRLLQQGSRIIFQLHYTASGRDESDRSRLGLYLSKEPPERELQSSVLIETEFRIPPGAREYATSTSRRFDREAVLYSMNPHMHLRGKSMRYTARYPDGTEEVLLNVPNYRFDWQRNYELKHPKLLPQGTVLTVDAAWDNSALNLNNPDPTQVVGWGEQTFDEMFYASYRYVYPSTNAPAAPSRAAVASGSGP